MELRLSVCILLLLCTAKSSNGEKILVWYTEASHWINMKLVLETLVDRGHQVTVLVPSSSLFMNSSEPSRFQYEPFDDVVLEQFMWKEYDKYYSEFRAFITHGGTNGIYEAIYHGVPMVGIPMFGDQPDNMVHMEAKGAALTVSLNFMTTESLRDAVNTVINNKS
ncbi:hypothetical protein GOODEAATRI_014307 [Goodea atripinnis]|uniref:UDP-glucuronosyltransferase n=1 Tax=Goodea atripinnis TaxID=208336 RepID=A0ABV0MUX3_9TELE